MPVIVASEGIQTTLVGTEYILTTVASPGVYVWTIQANSQRMGDTTIFRIKENVRSGGPLITAFFGTYANCLSSQAVVAPPFTMVYSASQLSLEVTASVSGTGTGSAGPPYQWRLDQIN